MCGFALCINLVFMHRLVRVKSKFPEQTGFVAPFQPFKQIGYDISYEEPPEWVCLVKT
jgi:hypothetical protein